MDHGRIRMRIREMIRTGALPCEDEPERVWAAEGNGRRCDACGQPIGPDETEFEVDLAVGATAHMHPACQTIWLEECNEPVPPS
jgi:hypothetical protein